VASGRSGIDPESCSAVRSPLPKAFLSPNWQKDLGRATTKPQASQTGRDFQAWKRTDLRNPFLLVDEAKFDANLRAVPSSPRLFAAMARLSPTDSSSTKSRER
jgi:hypothetical protein